MISLRWITLLIMGLSGVMCEVIVHGTCDDEPNNRCEVNSVSITPCKDAATGKPCKIKSKQIQTISLDITPKFDATELTEKVFLVTDSLNVEIKGMENIACLSTQCPVAKSRRQTYTYKMPILASYPKKVYLTKWVLSDGGDENVCCFTAKVEITK